MSQINLFFTTISNAIWGLPLISVFLGVGIYFTFKLKILKISSLKLAIKYLVEDNQKNMKGDISNFASLCTALSATLGTGNIVGIAVAITLGGPGAIFWLWVSSLISIATKYAEGLLAIKYRKISSDGKISGGPMYYIEQGLRSKFLAKVFAISGALVALVGIGTLSQSNSIAAAAYSFGIPITFTTIALSSAVAIISIGGVHRISVVSEKIVPIMTGFYISAALIILIIKIEMIPHAMYLIFLGAFSPEAIFGGGACVTVMTALHMGVSRGIFSHESGLGSAAIAAAAAKTDYPVKQGFISMAGAFLSVIVCTMTGLVLVITCNDTAIFSTAHSEETLLTAYAFGSGLGMIELGKYIVNLGIIFFAFTTIIGWNYYGEKCIQYIFGDKAIALYRLLFVLFVALGPFFKIDNLFAIADIVTGLMAVPNLIGLICLRNVIIEETRKFFIN